MAKEQFVKEVADMEVDFPQWYTDVVLKTELVDYGPVKGTMVIRPYGYAIWENIQKELNERFRATGHENAYFPMFIPESYLKREAEHVEGFAPEVALVTHAGGEKLAENLVVRPTSETIICEMYAKWMQSYRDLPIKLNQWANVCRWEKTTRPFLRTSEFLWQEGHTVHATEEEAREETLTMLGVYREFAENVLAIPVFTGRKTEKEKFAGAKETYGMEAMMLDGKSLQAGTSHYLGQNFAKAFNMKFLDKDGAHKYGYSSSWGVSTRLIGALIMAHGDQRGLVLPPKVAPVQAIIVPVAAHKGGVNEKSQEVLSALLSVGVRAKCDTRDMSPGWKFNEWEMKGVPVRIEIGPRDLERGEAVLFRRDTLEKQTVKIEEIPAIVSALLPEIQAHMLEKSKKFRDSRVKNVYSVEEMLTALDGKNFTKAAWCGERACEEAIKEKTAASSRVMTEDELLSETCVCCGKPAKKNVLFARAY
ncbi:MAG: proline--tRNA ligase [Clostridiales bacterium]|nr:proline--tRNA ligase [Clostridiales bacterium]